MTPATPAPVGVLEALVAKWRAEADMYEAEHNNQHGYVIDWEWHGKAIALERAADELEAALSPAELGGVEGPLRVFSEGAWVYEETGQRFRARDLDEAAFAEYLRHPLSTPRAAEAEWLPIESAPKDCPVIVSNGESVGEARYHESEDGWWWAGYHPTDVADGYVWQPTHWRPLPAPPSAKGE